MTDINKMGIMFAAGMVIFIGGLFIGGVKKHDYLKEYVDSSYSSAMESMNKTVSSLDNGFFTQEALETYPAKKPVDNPHRYFTEVECEKVTGEYCSITVSSTISATSSELHYWFSPTRLENPPEYPLQNKSWRFNKEVINVDGKVTKDSISLSYCTKYTNITEGCFWSSLVRIDSIQDEELKELYQLLKSKYECNTNYNHCNVTRYVNIWRV